MSLESGPYGPVLVVGGAGAGSMPATSTTPAGYLFPAGTSLYEPTIDPPTYGASFFHEYQAGCTTTVVDSEADGPLSCTGAETDPSADWPAFTTEAHPIAGPGVNPFLLGAVYRTDLGAFQVTYAGHPLYLFDPGPNSFDGANFYETVQPLPPENTAWFLLSPSGTPATGPASLETESPQAGTTYNSTELATEMLPGVGGAAVSVYTFSRDSHFSTCYDACARDFIPLETVGTPTLGAGVNPSAVGTVWRADGTRASDLRRPPALHLQPGAAPGRRLRPGHDRLGRQRQRCQRLRRDVQPDRPLTTPGPSTAVPDRALQLTPATTPPTPAGSLRVRPRPSRWPPAPVTARSTRPRRAS